MIKALLWILKVFVALSVLALGVYFLVKNDMIPDDVLSLIPGSESNLATYYQWSDGNGNVQITRTPPDGNTPFSTFKGDKDLVTSDQLVTPEQAPAESKQQPQIKVLSDHRDNLREQLLDREMTTQCRWLLNQLFNLEAQIKAAENDPDATSTLLCRDYLQYQQQLEQKHCKAQVADLKAEFC